MAEVSDVRKFAYFGRMAQSKDFRGELEAARSLPPGAERAERLYMLAHNYAEFAGSEAIDICRESLRECEELGLDPLRLTVKRTLGRCLAEQGKADEALAVLNEVLPEYEERHEILGIARTLNIMGSACELTGQFDEALEYFSRALLMHESEQDPELTVIVQNNIGVVYRKLGEYQSALVFQNKALKAARENGFRYLQARTLNSLGAIRTQIKDHEGALQCFMDSLEMASNLRPNMFQSRGMVNIGELNIRLGRHANALQWLYRAVAKAGELNDTFSLAHSRLSLGQAHAGLGNYAGALEDLTEAMRLFTDLNESYAQASCLQHIAATLLAMKELDSASRYVDQALQLAQEVRNVEAQTESAVLRIEIVLQMDASADIEDELNTAREQARGQGHTELLAQLCLLEAQWRRQRGDERAARRLEREHAEMVRREEDEEKRRKAERALLDAELNAALLSAGRGVPSGGFALVDDLRQTLRDLRRKRLEEMDEEAEPGAPRFVVRTLGRFAVEIDGRELNADDWKRKKARDIFKLLLINYKQQLNADFIINAIWGEAGGRNLTPSLWNAVSYLRKALEPGLKPHTPSTYILINDKSYSLDLGEGAEIDFIRFAEECAAARRLKDGGDKAERLAEALELYRGALLPEDVGEAWSEHERLSLQEEFTAASLKLAQLHYDHGAPQQAVQVLRNVLAQDELNHDAWHAMLEILLDTDQTGEARKAWQRCQSCFKRELDADPPAMLQALMRGVG